MGWKEIDLSHLDILCNVLLGMALPLFALAGHIADDHQLDTDELVDGVKV